MESKKKQNGYKGYLLIRCAHCGQVKGYNAKVPVKQHICPACGKHTNLEALTKIHSRCECGMIWRYCTNLTGRLEEVNCARCGRPITMERDKYGDYESI